MSRPSPSRRLFLQAGLVSLAGSALAEQRPPSFGTARYQFVELDPVATMAPVALRRADGRAGMAELARDHVGLIYLWATWCPVCRTELPRFERQLADFRRERVDILTICTDENAPAHVRAYLARLGVRSLPVLLDPAGKAIGQRGGEGQASPFSLAEGLPVAYLADRRGGVRGYLLGSADWRSPEATALLAHYGKV